jgi:hypothetical protein
MNFDLEVGFSLSAIKADLVVEVSYDNFTMFKHLRAHDFDNGFVSAGAAFLKEHKKEDIELLKKVEAQTSAIPLHFLEDVEVTDNANDRGKEEKSDNHGTAEEKTMYNPLVRSILKFFFFIFSDCYLKTAQLTGKHEYPSAIVSSIGHDQCLCTIVPLMGTSLPFLSRGTHVWLAREYVPADPSWKGDETIMKTAWGNSQKTPESKVYSSMKLPILGLAKFECGGDAIFSGATEYPMTVRNLRSDLHDHNFLCDYAETTSETPIFHRLILSTVGRPMWSYTTDLDLLTGFRDALQG